MSRPLNERVGQAAGRQRAQGRRAQRAGQAGGAGRAGRAGRRRRRAGRAGGFYCAGFSLPYFPLPSWLLSLLHSFTLQIQELADASCEGNRLAAAERIDSIRKELGQKRNKKKNSISLAQWYKEGMPLQL